MASLPHMHDRSCFPLGRGDNQTNDVCRSGTFTVGTFHVNPNDLGFQHLHHSRHHQLFPIALWTGRADHDVKITGNNWAICTGIHPVGGGPPTSNSLASAMAGYDGAVHDQPSPASASAPAPAAGSTTPAPSATSRRCLRLWRVTRNFGHSLVNAQ